MSMYLNPTLFPAITNRESWRQTILLSDNQDGTPIAFVDANNNGLYSFFLEIVPAPPSFRSGGFVPWPNPYYDDVDVDPILTDTIGAPLLAGKYMSIVDVGTLQIFVTKTGMQSLRGARSYDVYVTLLDSTIDDSRQILIGRLPVLYGGQST